MKKNSLPTPMILVDQDVLNRNIKKYQTECDNNKKQLWPMIKTHKSTYIAELQFQAGATGFLCGTLDECEILVNAGFTNIMYAYPVATQSSIGRIIELRKNSNIILRIDGIEAAQLVNDVAKKADLLIDYTIIINSGLNRLGISPTETVQFVRAMESYENLRFKGLSTHPGHVYAATGARDVLKCAMEEVEALKIAADLLKADGFEIEIITTGATPTFLNAVTAAGIDILHPGNYVFHDAVQIALGVATEGECALTILASVISNPEPGIFIIDAGSKTLGLDKGAHGSANIKGYGIIKHHPGCEIISLSEEVGKISVSLDSELSVGDKIEIIPNHACVPANLTSKIITCRDEVAIGQIEIDMRGNTHVFPNLQVFGG